MLALRSPLHRASLLWFVLSLACAAPALAASVDLSLGLSSLPTAQGWTYAASGSHAGVLESSVFSVAGGALIQNTIGQSNGVAGGSILYQISPGVTTTETKQLLVRARCLSVEGSANATLGQGGFIFGFATGSTQYAFGLTPTRLTVLIPSGTFVLANVVDNTQFHDYVFNWSPPGTYSLFRDGVLINTSSGGFAVAANRVFLGDGTGGANASGEVTQFRFLQGGATTAESTTWGRLKALYH